MPQLLHYLGVDDESQSGALEAAVPQPQASSELSSESECEGKAAASDGAEAAAAARAAEALRRLGADVMDWGVLAVYTCTASCSREEDASGGANFGSYTPEFIWRQSPL